jgi:hypothetical protein
MQISTLGKKIVTSVLLIILMMLSFFSGLDVILEKTIDKSGEQYINDTLNKAIYTYGIARVANGIISVIQSTEVNAAPAGIGMTFGVGEGLDPVNDIIERFSVVMLISTSSLGIQKVLMEIGTWLGFKILLSLSMLILLTGIWIPEIKQLDLVRLGLNIGLIAIVIRCCIPTIGAVGNLVDDLFLAHQYESSTQSLTRLNEDMQNTKLINGESVRPEDETSGYLEKLKSIYSSDKIVSALNDKLATIRDKLTDFIPLLIDLIAIFIIQTILLPIFVIWMLKKILEIIAPGKMPLFIASKNA